MKFTRYQTRRFYLLVLTFFPDHTAARTVRQYNPDPHLCNILKHPEYNCPDPIWCFSDWPHDTGNYGGDPIFLDKPIEGIYLTGGLFNWPKGWYDSGEFLDGKWPDYVNGTDHLGAQAPGHIEEDIAIGEELDLVLDTVEDSGDLVLDRLEAKRVVKRTPGHPHWRPRQEETSSELTPALDAKKKMIPNPNTCCRPTVECWNHLYHVPRTSTKKGDLYIESFGDWQKTVCCLMDWARPKDDCPMPDDQLPILWRKPALCSNNYTDYSIFPNWNGYGEEPKIGGS